MLVPIGRHAATVEPTVVHWQDRSDLLVPIGFQAMLAAVGRPAQLVLPEQRSLGALELNRSTGSPRHPISSRRTAKQ